MGDVYKVLFIDGPARGMVHEQALGQSADPPPKGTLIRMGLRETYRLTGARRRALPNQLTPPWDGWEAQYVESPGQSQWSRRHGESECDWYDRVHGELRGAEAALEVEAKSIGADQEIAPGAGFPDIGDPAYSRADELVMSLEAELEDARDACRRSRR